jgi:Uma2 family endonuclease
MGNLAEMNSMTAVRPRKLPRLSIKTFRAFAASRPDEERWELIDGVAMMMAPPTKSHQRIASNLESLLLNAIERHAPSLAAYQRLGVNLAPVVEHYDPEPDVVVVDAELSADTDERYAERFYLAAEVVSASDKNLVEMKREIYQQHEACNCVIVVQQDRYEVTLDLRTDTGWEQKILRNAEDVLALPEFGLRCKVADLYRGTALQARRAAQR